MPHINIITLGCSKNLVDSEKILGQLQQGPFTLSHDADGPADIVIINTCGFIHDAKEQSIETILQYTQAKKAGLVKEVIVMGCLAQRYKDDLKAEIPEADAWFGVNDTEGIFDYLKTRYNAENHERIITTPAHFAYLKIAEGCDRTCSFCAIPLIRGKYKSRSIQSLVAEAKALAEKGVKEILLIAQDLSYYGYDLQKKPMLAELLKELVKIEGIEWIRLHYIYPKSFPMEVLDIMAAEPKICRYLDIPLQHISDPILKGMRRNTTKDEIVGFLNEIRRKLPDVALRTTFLVGFPGETPQHFKELKRFIEEMAFDRLGVFVYSPEEGTRAYEIKDSVMAKTKQNRLEKIMELQSGISLEKNQNKIGKVFKVLIDREEAEYFIGRTQYDSPEVDTEVLITKSPGLKIGEFVNVEITGAWEYDLLGVHDVK